MKLEAAIAIVVEAHTLPGWEEAKDKVQEILRAHLPKASYQEVIAVAWFGLAGLTQNMEVIPAQGNGQVH